MAQFEDDELIDYVFGSLPEDRAHEIDRQAESDRELAAKIAVMMSIAGTSNRSTPAPAVTRSDSRIAAVRRLVSTRGRRALTIAAVGLALLTGIGWTAWAILHDPPLLQDDFNDRSFDAHLWMPQPEVVTRFNEPIGVSERNGYLKLVNRGYLITREEFRVPISLSFDWSWSELGPRLNPLYADNLTVTLRTTGKVSPTHPYEIEDGVRIMFNIWGPFVNIVQQLDGKGTVLGSTEDADLRLPMPADEWHKIRITDDGEKISVYMTGPKIGDRYAETPLLEVRCTQKFEGHHIAIYNREFLNETPHESLIDNVVVRAMPRKN